MSKNNNNSNLPIEMISFPFGEENIPKIEITSHPFTFIHHVVYLDQTIEDPKYYRELFNLLDSSNECDSVKFVVNTNGGDNDTMLQLMYAIKNTEAHTIAEIHKAYSAGSGIALCCDEVTISSFSRMMIHKGSMGVGGTANEVEVSVEFGKKHDKEVFEEIYSGFLTEEEIEKVLDGKTYYFNASEIKERSEKMAELKQAKQEEAFSNDDACDCQGGNCNCDIVTGEECGEDAIDCDCKNEKVENPIILENFDMGGGLV